MKLEVPFVENTKKTKGKGWCGPITLASLLKYYEKDFPIQEIADGSGTHQKGGTSPRGMAFFCLSNGLKIDYVNKYERVDLSREEYSARYRDFLKRFDEDKQDKKFKERCEKFDNYKFIKKDPTLDDIKDYLDESKPVLLFLNVGVVCEVDKLWSHYVLVVGYDSDGFFVHNIYPENQAYQKISFDVFDKAFSSDGMDRTLIVSYL